MNIAQKILTVVAIIAFIFGTSAASEPWNGGGKLQTYVVTWVVIGVVYTGLFFVFSPRRHK